MIERAENYINNVVDKYPKLKDQVLDIFYTFLDRTDDGNSLSKEYDIMVSNIKRLIKKYESNNRFRQ